MSHDPYEILQVHPNADQDAIQASYERLIALYDPARLTGTAEEVQALAQQRSQAIREAYAILADPQRRAAYDAQSAHPLPPGASAQNEMSVAQEPVLDYRPLPPARRAERPRRFDHQPELAQVSVEKHPLPRMLMLLGGLLLAVVIMSMTMSGGIGQILPANPQAQAQPTVVSATTATASPYDQYEAAISVARQDTEKRPNDPAAWVIYGNALYDSVQVVRENAPDSTLYRERIPRWLEASEAYAKALQLQGDKPSALVLADRGASLCYYGADNKQQSYVTQGLADTRTAATAAPNESLVLFNYGNCLISAEPPQIAEATRQWERILQVTPADSPIAARARELLNQHRTAP